MSMEATMRFGFYTFLAPQLLLFILDAANGISFSGGFRHVKNGHSDDLFRPGDDVMATLTVGDGSANVNFYQVIKVNVSETISFPNGLPVFVNGSLPDILVATGRYSAGITTTGTTTVLSFNITGALFEDRGDFHVKYYETSTMTYTYRIRVPVLGPCPIVNVYTGYRGSNASIDYAPVTNNSQITINLPIYQSNTFNKPNHPEFGCMAQFGVSEPNLVETFIGSKNITGTFRSTYTSALTSVHDGGLVHVSHNVTRGTRGEYGIAEYVPSYMDHGKTLTCTYKAMACGRMSASAIIVTAGKPIIWCSIKVEAQEGEAASVSCRVLSNPVYTNLVWTSPTNVYIAAGGAVGNFTSTVKVESVGMYNVTLSVASVNKALFGFYKLTAVNMYGSESSAAYVDEYEDTSAGSPMMPCFMSVWLLVTFTLTLHQRFA